MVQFSLALCARALISTALLLILFQTAAQADSTGLVLTEPTNSDARDGIPDQEAFVGEDGAELGPSNDPTRQDPSRFNTIIPGNPYGCMARTDRVHGSHSFASLHAKNIGCTSKPTLSVVGAEIMKQGWLGQWHRVAYEQAEQAAANLDVHAKKVCADSSMQTYRGNGYHRAVYGQTWYTARTSSDIETRFACNAH